MTPEDLVLLLTRFISSAFTEFIIAVFRLCSLNTSALTSPVNANDIAPISTLGIVLNLLILAYNRITID